MSIQRTFALMLGAWIVGCDSQPNPREPAQSTERYTTNSIAETKQVRPTPSEIDLRPKLDNWGLRQKAQGDRNTCSVCVVTSAFEYALSRKHDRRMLLSVEYLNWGCNQVVGNSTVDRGQFFHHLLSGFEQHGVCLEELMPYERRFSNTQPNELAMQNAKQIKANEFQINWIKRWSKDGALTDEQMLQIRQVLSEGWPVCLGSHHSRLCVGYRDDIAEPGDGKFFVMDSGGNGGFKDNTYDQVRTKTFDAFWLSLPLEQ